MTLVEELRDWATSFKERSPRAYNRIMRAADRIEELEKLVDGLEREIVSREGEMREASIAVDALHLALGPEQPSATPESHKTWRDRQREEVQRLGITVNKYPKQAR